MKRKKDYFHSFQNKIDEKSSSIKFRLNCFFVVSFDVLLLPHIKVLFAPSFNLFSEPIAPSVYTLTRFSADKEYFSLWVKLLNSFNNSVIVKIKYAFASILLIRTTSQIENIRGYLSGLSSPSGTDKIIAFLTAPVSNSAGQTRLPTFSSTTRSSSSVPNSSIPAPSFLRRDGTFRAYEAELI